MNKKINHIMLIIISIAGFAVSIFLVKQELSTSGFCPPFLGIPACHLISAAFALIFLSVFIRKSHLSILVFHTGFVPGLIMGINFSIRHIISGGVCPGFNGIPLCFVSLAVFILLGIIRIYFWD